MPANRGRGSDTPATYDSLTRKQIVSNLRRNIPKELIGLKAFVVFKFAAPKKPGGKRAKLPYYVKTKHIRATDHGSPDDIRDLVTFADAVKEFESNTRWAGIGICALKSNPVFFIDIDNCLDLTTGEINETAAELLTWNTYTEVSPSGKGLRMVMSSNPQTNRKKNGVELFSSSGFVTLTGQPLRSLKPVRKVSQQQMSTLARILDQQDIQSDDDIRSIPSPLDKERYRDVKKAIKHIDPDCSYDEWLLVGQALHSGDHSPNGKGFSLWLKWSQQGAKFEATSEEEMAKKWSSFNSGKGITLSSLFRLAQNSGYKGRSDNPIPDTTRRTRTKKPSGVQEVEKNPLAEGLFDNTGAYLFIGRAKIGKSRILAGMVSGAVTGSSYLGFKFLRKCKVLAFVLEEDSSELLERMRLYGVEPTEHDDKLVLVDEDTVAEDMKEFSEDYTWFAWLDKVLSENKPDFCYIDTAIKLKLMWQNDPDYKTKSITEQDYQNVSYIEQLARKHNCVIVSVMHASKRKANPNHITEPFDTIGTTSWALAGCTGAFVVGDKPHFNPLDEQDDGGRIFSVRGRYRQRGDTHYLLQSNPSGTFDNVGEYIVVQATVRQQEYLGVAWNMFRDGAEFITARIIAQEAGRTQHTVKVALEKFMKESGEYEGHRLVGIPGRGYTFQEITTSGRKKENVDDLLQ